jgi:hypothetical protein
MSNYNNSWNAAFGANDRQQQQQNHQKHSDETNGSINNFYLRK